MLLLSRDEHRAECIRVILSTLCEQCSSAAALHCKEMGLLLLLSFFFDVIFSRIKKKREMLPHECSKELQEERTPPLCRCIEEDASKRNPHWRAGCSRSSAKFLRKEKIYYNVYVYGESVLLLQQA